MAYRVVNTIKSKRIWVSVIVIVVLAIVGLLFIRESSSSNGEEGEEETTSVSNEEGKEETTSVSYEEGEEETTSVNNEEGEEDTTSVSNEEGELTFFEVVKKANHYPSDKPMVEESLISGNISFLPFNGEGEEIDYELTESDAQDLVALLKETKLTKSNERRGGSDLYTISLTNTNYTMSYQLDLFIILEKKEDKVFIGSTSFKRIYETTDSGFYDKLVELLKK